MLHRTSQEDTPFLTFREEAHATHALADCPHFIEGGPVNVKPCKIKSNEEKTIVLLDATDEEDENMESKSEDRGTSDRPKLDGLRLFVGNLGSWTTDQALEDSVSRYGKVTGVGFILRRESERPQGYAFVKMTMLQEAVVFLDARPH
ncbi:RNA-binding protein 3 [Taenia solium]|eukprot:TsM_000646400 transcript=TsM_000646400 gene=TsM_000646400